MILEQFHPLIVTMAISPICLKFRCNLILKCTNYLNFLNRNNRKYQIYQ